MQNNNPNRGQVYVREPEATGEVHIHVTGDRMPSPVFLKILDIMKLYIDKKAIVFAVYGAEMERLVRESLPKKYYDRIELRSLDTLAREEGLRRAG